MPFSMASIRMRNLIIKCITSKIPKIVTLQVRILKIEQAGVFCERHGKKAFLSTPGSMTLEAALALSLFIFASVSLILPMKIMTTERRIQAGLEAVGEDLSRYAYLQDALEQGKIAAVPGADDFAKAFCKNVSAGVAAGYAQVRALEHGDTAQIVGARMLRSSIREEGELFDLVLDYEIRMPFPVLGLGAVSRTARCSRRAWVGKEGKDEGEGGDGDGAEEDEIVYVGKGSTRYHKDRGCHYLSNTLTAVSYDRVGDRRNESGGKYYACSVCGRGAGTGSVVYIMPSGSSFHTSRDCSAIIAYVKAVPLSQVKHLGACSYCGR